MNLSGIVGRLWAAAPAAAHQTYHRLPLGLRRVLNRTLLSEQRRVVEVQSGLLQGVRMALSPRAESGFFLGTYEPDLQESLPKLITPGMTVYNLGANIGFFALALARLAGPAGRVVAFEPNPAVCARLIENLELNGLENRVKVERMAAGDFDGEAGFCFALSDGQGRFSDLSYVPKDAETTRVRCCRLDSYMRQGGPAPQAVLMDVEHAEGRVLRGMSGLLSERKPLVIVEMHGPEAIAEACAEFSRHRYRLAKLPELSAVDSAADVVPLAHYAATPVV